MENLEYLIPRAGATKTKGVSKFQKRFYDWNSLKNRGDNQIFFAEGHSKMDALQAALGSAVTRRERNNRGERYVTRRLSGNRIAIIRVS